jgi:hypothetical protein
MEDLQRLNVKFFLADSTALSPEQAFRVFNDWIPRTTDEVLVDVADYSHLAEGPLTLLVGHEANYCLDNGRGELGLLYSRKQPLSGSLSARLALVLQAALKACCRLEQEPDLAGKVKFRGDEFLLIANDRRRAANGEDGAKTLRAALEPVLVKLFAGAPFAVERDADPLLRLNLRVGARAAFDAAALLANLAGGAPA